jgi:hypothetical protein
MLSYLSRARGERAARLVEELVRTRNLRARHPARLPRGSRRARAGFQAELGWPPADAR